MKKVILTLSTAVFLVALKAQVTLFEPTQIQGLTLEEQNGYLLGSYKNTTDRDEQFLRIPGSDTENFRVLIVNPQTSDTLRLDEISFMQTGQANLAFRFFEYRSIWLRPEERVGLFQLKIADIERLGWNNQVPESKRPWIKRNRLSTGSYQVFFQWDNSIPMRSNVLTLSVP